MHPIVLTLACADRMGIVAAVGNFLLTHQCNIIDSAQFGDPTNQRFFMRVCFSPEGSDHLETLTREFEPVAAQFGMEWHFYDTVTKPRVLIMVSKHGHCLNDLLYRYWVGAWPVEIPAVVSNHRDFYQLAAQHDIPFHYLPIEPSNKRRQEERLLEIIETERCELIVLARYMQVLSPPLCAQLAGRVINIHHSFLPSFQGVKPYERAHARGVKLIGATAHYVTEELDEGPIIEQDVLRVDHAMSAAKFAAVGRDIESAVLSRAVAWHTERRVLQNGARTVVFK